jgi:hypothetical protein
MVLFMLLWMVFLLLPSVVDSGVVFVSRSPMSSSSKAIVDVEVDVAVVEVVGIVLVLVEHTIDDKDDATGDVGGGTTKRGSVSKSS